MPEMLRERKIIIKSMMQIDKELFGLKKNAPRRAELIRQKQLLLMELQNLKIDNHHVEISNEVITDHAVLRWLERKHGIDIKRIRDTMLSEEVRNAINDNPAGKAYWSDGEVVFVIDRGTVRTVIPINMPVEGEPACPKSSN